MGRHIAAEFTLLSLDFPLSGVPRRPPHIVDIRDIAVTQGLVKVGDAAGLAELAALALRKHHHTRPREPLPKPPQLSTEEQRTAALDAWALIEIHRALTTNSAAVMQTTASLGKMVTPSSPAGTPVSMVWNEREQAQGVLLSAPTTGILTTIGPDQQPKNITITQTRALVSITKVISPTASVPLHKRTLLSFGPPPFTIAINYTRLRLRITIDQVEDPTAPGRSSRINSSQSLVPDPMASVLLQPLSATSQSVLSNLIQDDNSEDGDDETDDDDDNYLSDHYLVRPPAHQLASIPSSGMDSGIAEDVWHVMDRVSREIPIKHSLRKAFTFAFSNTIFALDEDDYKLVCQTLQARPADKRKTWDEMRRYHPDWLWRRVRRFVPEKNYLEVVLREFFQCWGKLQCSKTGLPLFNKTAWKRSEGVLESVSNGWVSDPPGISLYVRQGTDAEGLPLYRCLRGTNSIEGGVHMQLMRTFGSLNASVEGADCLLADFRHRHNVNVCKLTDAFHKTNSPQGRILELHWENISWSL